jgi:DNA-binding response OmpR family regulator
MKILIIEDDKEIANFIKKGLETELLKVEIASDGERGSLLARSGHYALIILDYILPIKNGAEVLKEIRAEGINIPILMLTVKAEIESKKKIFSLGADDYLSKPFLFDELLLHVKALLKRPLKINNSFSRLDDLTINHDSKIVKRGKKEIYLTRKEFMLLEYLMENKGKIVSRTQILDYVWNYDSDPFSNSIETHIASLRKKINLNKSRDLIHTFTGRGYKLSLRKLD